MNRDEWAARKADLEARRGKCGHGSNCQCRNNIGYERFVAETARLKAKHDELGYASPPRGRWRQRV